MPDLFPVRIEDQIRCVQREIEMREKVYPRWVDIGRMSYQQAMLEIDTMREVKRTLETAHRLAAALREIEKPDNDEMRKEDIARKALGDE